MSWLRVFFGHCTRTSVYQIPPFSAGEFRTLLALVPGACHSLRVNAQVRPLYCDGCGLPAIASHLRRRYERLEWATKFRPIHIQVLLLNDAPPPLIEDFFYRPGTADGERSGYHRIFFEELMAAAGISLNQVDTEAEALAKFQQHGFFLADICECPMEEIASAAGESSKLFVRPAHIRKFAPIVLKRIEHSYKPKRIVPIGADSGEVVPALQQAGMADRLVLEDGRPIFDPYLGDPAGSAEFATSLGHRIEKALAAIR